MNYPWYVIMRSMSLMRCAGDAALQDSWRGGMRHAWLIETYIQKHAWTHCHRDLSLDAGTGKEGYLQYCSVVEERLRHKVDPNSKSGGCQQTQDYDLGLRSVPTNHPPPNHIMRQHCDCHGEDGLRWARFVIGLILPQLSPWGSFHFVSPFLQSINA